MDNQRQTAALRWTLDKHFGEMDTYRSGANLKIVLNRPRNGNALSTDMVSQMLECFTQSAEDPSISRIIITAQGRFFCTGMDLNKSTTGIGKEEDVVSSRFREFVQLFDVIDKSPKVTIACINGPCYAGGVGLAFACDIRLAAANASATVSEVKLGLCPAIISKYLAREWGLAFMREAMLSGRTIPITELQAIGAVHGIAENSDDLQRMLDTYLTDLSRCAPAASTMCKHVAHVAWSHQGTAKQDEAVRQVFERMMRPGAESTIGVRNFQNKKVTNWDSLWKPLAKL